MRKTILLMMALVAIISCDGLTQDASADGIAIVPHSKKVRHVYHAPTCGHERCVVHARVACPDRYSCYSLYGAYGPYGGAPYWNRYSYEGWGYRR